MSVRAYVALGANLGDAARTVAAAIEQLGALPRTRLAARSRLYLSAPVDAGGPDYVNAVAGIDTDLPAQDLLAQLQALERAAGRTRPYWHAPRTLDLDLLLYGHEKQQSATLTLPHPRMQQRAFVLRPLAEIAPDRVSAAALRAVANQACRPLATGAAAVAK